MARKKQTDENSSEVQVLEAPVIDVDALGLDPEEDSSSYGVDPETGELISITPDGLRKVYGLSAKQADKVYCSIAGLDHGLYFFNPANEPAEYRPPLRLGSLDESLLARKRNAHQRALQILTNATTPAEE